jgi:hypothetical protein
MTGSDIKITGWQDINANYFIDINKARQSALTVLGGHEYHIKLCNEYDFLNAYNMCPPLKSILGKRAKMFNTGKYEIVNKNTGKPARGQEGRDILNLLTKPNVLQTGKQFKSQQYHYIDIFGYCPVLKMKPVGMSVVTQMWNIPPWLFDLDYTRKWLMQNKREGIYKSFWLTWEGFRMELKAEDLFFVFDDGIGTQDDTDLTIPDSRLVGMDYMISNIAAAYKTRNTLITKRGAIGILSNEGSDKAGLVPLREGEKELIQQDFKKYGLVGQPFQIIITESNLKWQQMGFATKDLLVFEEIEDNIDRLCDAYGWPVELMSRNKGTTYANKKEAVKSVYRDTVIPEDISRTEQLSSGLLPPDSSFVIQVHYRDVEVLKEDLKIMAEGRRILNEALKIEYINGLITKNDWLEKLGEERREDPEFDKYYVAPEPSTPIPPRT